MAVKNILPWLIQAIELKKGSNEHFHNKKVSFYQRFFKQHYKYKEKIQIYINILL